MPATAETLAPAVPELRLFIHEYGTGLVQFYNRNLNLYATQMHVGSGPSEKGITPTGSWALTSPALEDGADFPELAPIWAPVGTGIVVAASAGGRVPVKLMWDLRTYHTDGSESVAADRYIILDTWGSWQLMDPTTNGSGEATIIENVRIIWPAVY